MPLTMTLDTTAGGRKFVRSATSGQVDEADALKFMEAFKLGGPYHGLALLTVVEKNTSYTTESRRIFVQPNEGLKQTAIVVTSAPLRVMLNFMVKATSMAGRAETLNRFFSTAAEAEAWLDEPALK
jgi:hypothetical protein